MGMNATRTHPITTVPLTTNLAQTHTQIPHSQGVSFHRLTHDPILSNIALLTSPCPLQSPTYPPLLPSKASSNTFPSIPPVCLLEELNATNSQSALSPLPNKPLKQNSNKTIYASLPLQQTITCYFKPSLTTKINLSEVNTPLKWAPQMRAEGQRTLPMETSQGLLPNKLSNNGPLGYPPQPAPRQALDLQGQQRLSPQQIREESEQSGDPQTRLLQSSSNHPSPNDTSSTNDHDPIPPPQLLPLRPQLEDTTHHESHQTLVLAQDTQEHTTHNPSFNTISQRQLPLQNKLNQNCKPQETIMARPEDFTGSTEIVQSDLTLSKAVINIQQLKESANPRTEATISETRNTRK
jgi:hypothetical protein